VNRCKSDTTASLDKQTILQLAVYSTECPVHAQRVELLSSKGLRAATLKTVQAATPWHVGYTIQT
jgi:hypothetical protein